MMQAGEQEVFSRSIELSNLDKVFFPETGITKGRVVEYYRRIAETMLPHLHGRPVAVKRFPDGLDGSGFFQKNAGSHFPGWLRRQEIEKRGGGTLDHVVIDEPAAFVYLADQGAIEFHPWLSEAEDLEHPVEVVFDLDPPEDADVAAVRRATRRVGDLLESLELPSRVKTSGSAGFHVHVPLDESASWGLANDFAHRIADEVARRHPHQMTARQRKEAREGRVFVDWLRNSYGQTSIAGYSVRARPSAPVATPITWEELSRTEPRTYHLGNIFRRLGQRDDPWIEELAPVGAERLEQAIVALSEMAANSG